MRTDRRTFLETVVGGAALSGLVGLMGVARPALGAAASPEAASATGPTGPAGLPGHFPHQDPERVRRVVGASHGDLDTVRELVGKRPELAKAQWDWGFGDWESALGAASHTGRREIAELLLAHGARPTLFSAAMLGQLGVVKAFVEAFPAAVAVPGPHGIPLLAHARAGGEPAAAVVEYLEGVGGADGPEIREMGDEERQRFVGSYAYGSAPNGRLEVTVGPRGLMIGQPEGTARGLVPVDDGVFHPAGAPSVRVRFDLPPDGPASALSIHDPDLLVRAERAP